MDKKCTIIILCYFLKLYPLLDPDISPNKASIFCLFFSLLTLWSDQESLKNKEQNYVGSLRPARNRESPLAFIISSRTNLIFLEPWLYGQVWCPHGIYSQYCSPPGAPLLLLATSHFQNASVLILSRCMQIYSHIP